MLVSCRPVTPGGTAGFPFQPLRTGAGGQICGIVIANDGTVVVRCDSFGGFVLPAGASKWVQLCQASALPFAATVPLTAFGIYEAIIAPTNSQIMYMLYGQVSGGGPLMFSTTNRGLTWNQCTNWTQVAGNSNSTGGNPRLYGPKGAVDLANPDCFIMTMQDGKAYECTNGTSGASATFTQLSAITTGTTNDAASVCFEPTTSATYGTTSGRSNNVYVSSSGQGLWLRTSPGGTFASITGAPATIYRIRAAADGTIYLVTSANALIKLTWSAGPGSTPTFTTLTPGITVNDVALNPASASQVTAFNFTSGWTNSANAGSTWSGVTSQANEYTATSADAPYLTSGRSLNYTQGSIQTAVADTSGSGLIYFAGWQGVYTTAYPIPTPPSLIALTSLCHGIEQLAANVLVVPPGGNAILCQQDWGVMLSGLTPAGNNPDALSVSPIVQGWNTNATNGLCSCNHADWASTDPTFIVAMITANDLSAAGQSAFNTHSGTGGGSSNWTQFTSSLPQGGTCIAVADTNNWVVIGNTNLYRTNNGGGSWTQISSPGGNASATSGWTQGGIAGHWKGVCVDRVANGSGTFTFYAMHPTQGLFTSTDNGATWTDIGAGAINFTGSFYGEMKTVGGNQGHLFFSMYGGSGGSPASSYPSSNKIRFYRTTDGGNTWTVVGPSSLGVTGTIVEVWSWDWGAPAPGQTYPAIYIYGWIFTNASTYQGYTQAIWRCSNIANINVAGGWEQISYQYPDNWTDWVRTIAADKNVYGRVYFSKNGSSYGVGQITL